MKFLSFGLLYNILIYLFWGSLGIVSAYESMTILVIGNTMKPDTLV